MILDANVTAASSVISTQNEPKAYWMGPQDSLTFDKAGVQRTLLDLNNPVYLVNQNGQIGAAAEGILSYSPTANSLSLAASAPPLPYERLGDPAIQKNLRCPRRILFRGYGKRDCLGKSGDRAG